jgi:myo-inositol 2-dehydrogenase/D-chiro-inositol 1-dehydrogenase
MQKIEKKIGLALFGLGRAGRFHLESLRATSRARLLHVADVDPARAAEVAAEWECMSATSPTTALADPEVDAVIVATPTETHRALVEASLTADKAVLAEKPLGIDLAEIDACYRLASERGKPLFLAFNRRFDPSFAELARRVHAGDVGPLQILRTTSRDSPLPSVEYIRTSGGIFHDCIVHDLDMIRFIARENPVEVFAMGSSFIPEIGAIPDLDTVLVTLRLESGALASIDISRQAVYGYDQRVEVFGPKGMLQSENRAPTSTVLSTADATQHPPIEYSFPTRYREAYRAELETFLECVEDGRDVPVSHDDVRWNFVLAEAAERSHRERRPIPIEPPPPLGR